MEGSRENSSNGLTLIEVLVTIVVVAVAVLGAMGYRYWCALDARRADVQITGARLGWMLLENWKAAGGDATYQPEMKRMQLPPGPGPAHPTGFVPLGSYHAYFDGVHYYATLSSKDAAATAARTLNVNVGWMKRYQEWDASGNHTTLSLTTCMH
jgi:prepilin-type N-terminal cleavage/methylation domain-containing protein